MEVAASTEKYTWQSGFKKSDGKSEQSPPAQSLITNPSCPECASRRVWRDGLRYLNDGETVQRWLCRDCSYRFSDSTAQPKIKVHVSAQPVKIPSSINDHFEPFRSLTSTKKLLNNGSLTINKDVDSHPDPDRVSSIAFKYRGLNNGCRRVRVSGVEAKNLAEVESRTEKRAAGATETKTTLAKMKGKIVEHAFWLKKNGYKESMIKTRTYHLRILMKRGANILDPESVKETIAKLQVKEGTKAQYVATYHIFALQNGSVWDPPDYKQHQKIPFIPTEDEVDQLIAACGKKNSTLLQLLKETAMRIGEAWRLKWTDIDFERNLVMLNDPEKNSKARVFNVSNKLIGMLKGLPKTSKRVIGYTNLDNKKHDYLRFRKRLAQRLQNPGLLKITFHTFRHWKATMLYHETKDILFVMDFLGHRDIRNTMRYIQLEKALFNSGKDQFHVRVAKNVEEACSFVEVGFEYVTGNYDDGGKIFRKRK